MLPLTLATPSVNLSSQAAPQTVRICLQLSRLKRIGALRVALVTPFTPFRRAGARDIRGARRKTGIALAGSST